MNILPKKNWHVRNKDNIEKVRRDETKAAQNEKEKERKRELAESESRLNLLRSKAGLNTNNLSNTNDNYLNLFEQEEHGLNKKNKETEDEKLKEKEKYEKKIGLLKYLKDDSLDLKCRPWYETFKRKSNDDTNEIDIKRKALLDPIRQFTSNSNDTNNESKTKKSNSSIITTTTTSSTSKTIEQLRAERLKRELEERERVNKLLNKNLNDKNNKIELDDRKRKYNSQFNPNLSKY